MLTRRRLLIRSLQGSSLLAVGGLAPRFLVETAAAAVVGRENVLVVLELTGGNDGLNTVVPWADDEYRKARPTLALSRQDVMTLDDRVGLNPGLRPWQRLVEQGQVAVVQGVGYPNPNRSHFESMDVWQSGDPAGQRRDGWLGRGLGSLSVAAGHAPAMYVGTQDLPLALRGSAGGAPALDPRRPFGLDLADEAPSRPSARTSFSRPSAATAPEPRDEVRMELIRDVTGQQRTGGAADNELLQFVQRTSLQSYATVDELRELVADHARRGAAFSGRRPGESLRLELSLVAHLIRAGFGTRVFYVTLGGFDTHADQRNTHQQLLGQLATAVNEFFGRLQADGHAGRVLLLTFSEFGRRVRENGSRGTDHGSGSCLFVVGPAARGGLIGETPSLAAADLDGGDVKFRIDFRRVYATLLDRWLGIAPEKVLTGPTEPLDLLRGPTP
jgi:uncharacterized protein (DUF1501 family)